MSNVGGISAVGSAPAVGGGHVNVQIAVHAPKPGGGIANAQLNAALQRLSMILYTRAHCEVPPTVTDFGGGLFNVVV